MARFTPLRNRDAWSIIRGYVYQVDLTIERWLNLPENHLLELERGEDIDLVAQAIGSPEEERQRILEQVKHRDQALTLRTPAAIESLANAVAHYHANPNLALLFRYTTNAGVGRERPSLLPQGEPVIGVWEQLRAGTYPVDKQPSALTAIQSHLRLAQKPEGVPSEVWDAFESFARDADSASLLAFIHVFEWSVGTEDVVQLSQHIQQDLIVRGHAADRHEANDLYHRLFFAVFKLLSQPGLKRLAAQDLLAHLSQPLSGEADRALLARVRSILDEHSLRLQRVEQSVEQHSAWLLSLESHVQQLASDQADDLALRYTIAAPILDMPPLPGEVSQRAETASHFQRLLEHHIWIALYGSMGTGKTILATLLALASGTCRAWVRFRDLSIAQACQRLDTVCQIVAGTPAQPRSQPYDILCRTLGQGALIVLDDLPRLNGNDELSQRLLSLVGSCQEHGLHLLSTSPYVLPHQLQTHIGPARLVVVETPPLTAKEVAETLHAYGAPNAFLRSATVHSLQGMVRGHPVLIGSIARYLQRHQWQLDDAVFEGLLRQAYANDINDGTMHSLLQQVADRKSLDLLYRLIVPFGSFSLDDVYCLAAVDPEVERPRERLNDLLGLWVQGDAQGQLLVSPLVKALGNRDLTQATLRACHRVLGEQIVSRGTLSQFDVSSAISHLLSAGLVQRAGELLIFGLRELLALDVAIEDAGLLMLWASLSLPEEMELGTRICLRAFQIAARRKRGLDISFPARDVDALISQASAREASALLLLIINNRQLETMRWLAYIRRFLELLPDARHLDQGLLRLPDGESLGQIIWFCGTSLSTDEHYTAWMDIVALLPLDLREHAFYAAPAEEASMHITDRPWLLEAEKPADQQQWEVVYQLLTTLAERARALDLPLLWACAARSQIIVLHEYLHDLEAAVVVAEVALAQLTGDVRAQFIIQECIGRQYSHARQLQPAERWLRQAMQLPTQAYPETRVYALLHLAEAASVHDQLGGLHDLQQAAHIVETAPDIFANTKVKVYAELALAHWFLEDRLGAYTMWERAAEHLLSSRADTSGWKSLFVIFGHVSGYLQRVAATGEGPSALPSGEEYAAPVRGMFLTSHPARAGYYDPLRDSFLAAQLSYFAEAVGQTEQSIKWASQALELARRDRQWFVIADMGERVIPQLLRASKFDDVLGIALDIGPAYQAMQEERRQRGVVYDANLDIDALLGPKPGRPWLLAEFRSAISSLVPIAFYLSTIALEHPGRARAYAQRVALLCRQIGAAQVNPSLWLAATDVLSMIAEGSSSYAALMGWGRRQNGEFDVVLQFVSYMAATWQPDASLEQVAAVHLSLLPTLTQKGLLPVLTYNSLVVPYISRYWANAFARERFRFRTPRIVEEAIGAESQLLPGRRAQHVLQAIAYGLDISVSPEIQQWFQEE